MPERGSRPSTRHAATRPTRANHRPQPATRTPEPAEWQDRLPTCGPHPDDASQNAETLSCPTTDLAIRQAIATLVATAPPLSEEMRIRLAGLLAASRRRAD